MSRENFGPGVREVIHMIEDNQKNLDLGDLAPGDQLFIKVGDRPQDMLDFVITAPAKKEREGVNDSAYALLPGWKWSSRCTEEKVKILIGGSCTYRPGSPFSLTLLSIGRLTVGRHLVIWLDETDEAVIFRTTIQRIEVVSFSFHE